MKVSDPKLTLSILDNELRTTKMSISTSVGPKAPDELQLGAKDRNPVVTTITYKHLVVDDGDSTGNLELALHLLQLPTILIKLAQAVGIKQSHIDVADIINSNTSWLSTAGNGVHLFHHS